MFRKEITCVVAIVFSSMSLCVNAAKPASKPASQEADATVKVQAVRITRAPSDLQRRFGGRYYADGSPGVSMTLLLTFNDASLLPISRDALNIDTFVDDTYENLQSREGGFSGNPPSVSEDGKMVMLTIMGNKGPADDASRVFVRGTISARAVRGDLKTAKAKMPRAVGQKTDVGPFKVTLRSVTDNGQGRQSMNFYFENDPGRIRSIRALDAEGNSVILQDQEPRMQDQGSGDRGMQVYVNLSGRADPATLELNYAEKVENLRIPFEAQVDIGVTKAGPIDVVGAKKSDARTSAPKRVWPPPPPQAPGAMNIPDRRQPFSPSTQPIEAREVAKSAVDVFSLTVGKPAPDEADGVKWNNPPSQMFRASGFTIARLMVSTPGVTILNIPDDGITVSKFEDDKGKHDTTFYRDPNSSSFASRNYTQTSPDGQQALVSISMTSAPTTGATKCMLAGTVRANAARGEHKDESKPFSPKRNQSIKLGPYTLNISEVRQAPAMNPAMSFYQPPYGANFQMVLSIQGPADRLRSIDVLDGQLKQVVGQYRNLAPDREFPAGSTRTAMIGMREASSDQLILRVSYYDKTEVVEIPFDITTGIGL
jgi:hypothetical protein